MLLGDYNRITFHGLSHTINTRTAGKEQNMKKSFAGVLCIFGMRLILTVVSCVILRWGINGGDASASVDALVDEREENAKWVAELTAADKTNQIMVVAVDGSTAALSLYQKTDGVWMEYLTTEAYIGKKGIGKVREGDGRTPIGEFCFTKAFGILESPDTELDYIQVDESYYWVDDANSTYYNRLVSTEEVEMDWQSAEHICEYGQVYHYVLSISYNEDCVPGVGSAIFLHCTAERPKATDGCIAVSEEALREILQVLEKDCVLIIDTAERVCDY